MNPDGVSRRELLRWGCVGTVGTYAVGGVAATGQSAPDIALERNAGGGRSSSRWEYEVVYSGLQVVPTDAETIRFGGDTGRWIRVRNTDTGKSVTYEPATDGTVYDAQIIRLPNFLLFDFDTIADARPVTVETESATGPVDVAGEWRGYKDIYTEQPFGTYVAELLDDSGSVLATTNSLYNPTNYTWQAELSGDTARITRHEGVREDWNVQFAFSDESTDLRRTDTEPSTLVENNAGDDFFTIDVSQFERDLTNSRWALQMWDGEMKTYPDYILRITGEGSDFEGSIGDTSESGDGELSIDPATVDIPTAPVTTDDEPAVTARIENAESATVRATYEDGSGNTVEVTREMVQRGPSGEDGEGWGTREPLPGIGTPGTWVDITVEAENADGETVSVDSFEGWRRQENDDIGYHVFETVMRGVVIEGRFEGRSELAEEELQYVRDWEKARQYDINHYFGSSRGAMGAVGFDLTFERDGDDLYELPKSRSDYGGGIVPKLQSANKHLVDDLKNEASDVAVDDYDFWVGTHRQSSINGKRGMFFQDGSAYIPELTSENGLYVWLHELAHVYGLFHLYEIGMRRGLCMLGKSSRGVVRGGELGEPSLSTGPRMADALSLKTGSGFEKSDSLGDMLSPEVVPFSETSDGKSATIPALNSLEYGETVPIIHNKRTIKEDIYYVMEARTHLGEERDGSDTTRWWYAEENDTSDPHGSAVIYRRDQAAGRVTAPNPMEQGEFYSWGSYNLLQNDNSNSSKTILLERGDVLQDKLGTINPTWVEFHFDGKSNGTTPEEFSTEITVRQASGDPGLVTMGLQTLGDGVEEGVKLFSDGAEVVGDGIEEGGDAVGDFAEDPVGSTGEAVDSAVEGTKETINDGVQGTKNFVNDGINRLTGGDDDDDGGGGGIFHSEDSLTVPSLHLVAEDADGNRIGPAEDGAYESEIPGARTSGTRVGGVEWISVPADADVTFSVDSSNVEKRIQELVEAGLASDDPSDDQVSTDELRERFTTNYDVSETRYGENPELTTRNGQPWVTDTTVRVERDSVEPGTQTAAEPSNAAGAIDLVTIDNDAALSEEAVTFENRSGDDLAVGGWTVTALDGDSYTFPDGTSIAGGETLTLYSRSGSDGDGELFWGADEAVWNPEGGTLEVTDTDGQTKLDIGYDGNGVIYYDPAEVTAGSGGGLPMTLVGLGAVSAGMLYLAARLRSGDSE